MDTDAIIAKVESTFAQFPQEKATMADMGSVAKVGVWAWQAAPVSAAL